MLSARDTVWSGTSPVDPAVQPFGLYLVQILVVLGIARLLAVALARIRQPRVIAGMLPILDSLQVELLF